MSLSVQCPMCGLDITGGAEAKEVLLGLSEHKQKAHNMPAMSQKEMDGMRSRIRGATAKAKPWWRRGTG
jgi:predicted small metal-binding protein